MLSVLNRQIFKLLFIRIRLPNLSKGHVIPGELCVKTVNEICMSLLLQ